MKRLAILLLLWSIPASAADDMGNPGNPTVCNTIICGIAETLTMNQSHNRWYVFEPKDDITPIELAVALKAILPFIASQNPFRDYTSLIDELPPNVKRHFREEH